MWWLSRGASLIVQLKIENKNMRAENQRLRAMLIKEEPMDPVACVKEEPGSDDGESSVSIISLRKHQSHTDSPYSPSILTQAKQEIQNGTTSHAQVLWMFHLLYSVDVSESPVVVEQAMACQTSGLF